MPDKPRRIHKKELIRMIAKKSEDNLNIKNLEKMNIPNLLCILDLLNNAQKQSPKT